MDLRQAAYVVAVVDHGTFTAAAAAIPVSQPALSQAVASLERELGTPLFHRIGRQVRLTSAGEAFLEPARQLLRDAATARAAVADVAGLTAGTLDVVALPTLVVDPLVPVIGRFRAAHPDVTVRISEPEDADDVARRVRSGASELGFGDVVPDDPLLAHDPIGRQSLLAVLPPATVLRGRRIRIDRLASMPLVTTPPGTSTRRLLAAALRREDPKARLVLGVITEHREAIVPLVLAGAGAALLPETAAHAASRSGAVVAPIDPPLDRELVLLRRTGPLSPAAATFRSLALDAANGRDDGATPRRTGPGRSGTRAAGAAARSSR